MNITDLRIGSTFELEGKIYQVVEYQRVSRPRLAALIQTKIKNIETGQVIERNFGPAVTVGEAFIERKDMQFLYNDGDLYYFMDVETYEQMPIDKANLGDALNYLKDGMMFNIHSCKEKIIGVVPPIFVELEVTKCDPAVVGDTAKNATKPATLESGYTLRVPMFISEGDVIKIDTRTGDYVERVKN